MKRQHAHATKPGAKKAKVVDRVQQCLDTVAAALQQAPDLPMAASAMLCGMLPTSLGVEQDARHRYQQEMVEAVAEELAKIEGGCEKSIEGAEAAVAAATADKEAREGAVTDAKSALEAAQAALAQRKAELAEDALAFRAARSASEEAEYEQQTKCLEADAAVPKKAELEGLLEQVETAHESKPEIDRLMKKLLKHLAMDDSLETAMPSALAKAPAERGPFDVMVFDQLRSEASAKLAALGATIEAAVPMKAALAEAVSKASAALQQARDKQVSSASTYMEQKAKADAAEEAVHAAQKACKDAAAKLRKEEKARDSAQATLDLFRQGALAAFEELRNRQTAAPELEQAAEAATEGVALEAATAAVA